MYLMFDRFLSKSTTHSVNNEKYSVYYKLACFNFDLSYNTRWKTLNIDDNRGTLTIGANKIMKIRNNHDRKPIV